MVNNGEIAIVNIIECKTDEEIISTHALMKQLRPQLPNSNQDYLSIIKQLRDQKGYQLLSLTNNAQCVALAGCEMVQRLATGSTLYIADLVTDETHRSKGYGTMLINYIKDIAKKLNFNGVILDSGTQRHDAHRFYEREGFQKTAFHFIYSTSK